MYTEIKPGMWAISFVDAYWTMSNTAVEPSEMTIIPDLCCDIMLSIKNSGCACFAVGCMTGPVQASIEPGETVLGIRFRPGCAGAVLGIPLNEITDIAPPLININAQIANVFQIETLPATTAELRGQFDNALCSLLQDQSRDSMVAAAIRTIETHQGLMPVETLAQTLGITRRSLERRFLASTGIKPKLFLSISRFRRARNMLQKEKDISLVDAALRAGYYDQAHFCRDFKKFSGTTPSQH